MLEYLDGSKVMALTDEYSTEWLLYFLFAYVSNPPTDATYEHFEAAHDRAVGTFKTPDEMMKAKGIGDPQRWRQFCDRYNGKTKAEVLTVIGFFLNVEIAPVRIVPA